MLEERRMRFRHCVLVDERELVALVALKQPRRIADLVDTHMLAAMMGRTQHEHVPFAVNPLGELLPVGQIREVRSDPLEIKPELRCPLEAVVVRFHRPAGRVPNAAHPARRVHLVDEMVVRPLIGRTFRALGVVRVLDELVKRAVKCAHPFFAATFAE